MNKSNLSAAIIAGLLGCSALVMPINSGWAHCCFGKIPHGLLVGLPVSRRELLHDGTKIRQQLDYQLCKKH